MERTALTVNNEVEEEAVRGGMPSSVTVAQ
jgi:hypothetical protein